MNTSMPTAIDPEPFFALCDNAFAQLKTTEVLLCSLRAENTNFVRFNHCKVRQSGCVTQASLQLRLIRGSRHASHSLTVSGQHTEDELRVRKALAELRDLLTSTPDDPFLLYNTEISSSETVDEVALPSAEEALEAVQTGGDASDLVGIWASGDIVTAFANSLGQRNWHATASFNFDFSIYDRSDKAAKGSYAGKHWERRALLGRLRDCKEQVSILRKSPKTISPGGYRVFLAPAAMAELLALLAWDGFSAEEQHARRSSLLRAVDQKVTFSPKINLRENIAAGVCANFDSWGFLLPERTPLIESGRYRRALVSPRSASQFDLERNCGEHEAPKSLELDGGELETKNAYEALDTGIYVSNLWYLNYSDRNACRVTGMTRFATVWVENGRPRAPLNVMRLDDSLYRMLGENLIDLTQEQEAFLDPASYGRRSTESARLPGALLRKLEFTL